MIRYFKILILCLFLLVTSSHLFSQSSFSKERIETAVINFLKSQTVSELDFRAHSIFKKQDIEDRQRLVQRICEKLWSAEYFNTNN